MYFLINNYFWTLNCHNNTVSCWDLLL